MNNNQKSPDWDDDTERDREFEKTIFYPEFYEEFSKNLDKKFPGGWYSLTPDGNIYSAEDGTGGWAWALLETCKSLNKEGFWEYWLNLPWYDSDRLDDELLIVMIEYLEEK